MDAQQGCRSIWVLKASPKTGRAHGGNSRLLIKRMKSPNIDFVLHHHTKQPTKEMDDSEDYHSSVNQSKCIYQNDFVCGTRGLFVGPYSYSFNLRVASLLLLLFSSFPSLSATSPHASKNQHNETSRPAPVAPQGQPPSLLALRRSRPTVFARSPTGWGVGEEFWCETSQSQGQPRRLQLMATEVGVNTGGPEKLALEAV